VTPTEFQPYCIVSEDIGKTGRDHSGTLLWCVGNTVFRTADMQEKIASPVNKKERKIPDSHKQRINIQ